MKQIASRSNQALSRRQMLISTTLGGIGLCVSGCQTTETLAAEKISQPLANITPPITPRVSFPIEQLGRTRNDPYHWIKYIPETGTRTLDTLPERLKSHLIDETEYAEAVLAPTETLQIDILNTMQARLPDMQSAPPLSDGPYAYFNYYPENSAYPVYARIHEDNPEQTEILLDEAERADGQSYFRSTEHQHSPDHRYFVWAEDIKGNDRHRICALDTKTGKTRIWVETDAYGYGGVTIAPSSKRVFWVWRNSKNRPTRVYRTDLSDGKQTLVYEEKDPAIFIQVKRTAGGGYVSIILSGPDTSEVRLISAKNELSAPELVFQRRDKVHYEVEEWGDKLLSLTDADGAIDNKLIAISPDDFSRQTKIIPAQSGRQILEILPFKTALVIREQINSQYKLRLLFPNGQEKAIEFDEPAYTVKLLPNQSYEASECRVIYQSPKTPPTWIDIDLNTASVTEIQKDEPKNYNPDDYIVERLFATAGDGETVPITLLSHRNHKRDGSVPLLLYGYGAYGVSSDPTFSIPATVLVDRGWNYAIAHVRGGSEKGREWFLDGRKFNKRNSFTDFIACAEDLNNWDISSRSNIVAYGLSAGGLLVGGAMNLDPEMWAGVIAKVPFVDMLNTMSDAEHPLVPLFRPDWGDPLANPKAYDYIYSISPYENVRQASYPPLLTTAGLKDDRVGYWEPAKLVAEIRHKSTSDNPAILKLNVNSGHQGSAGTTDELSEMALFWSFAEVAVADGFRE